MFVRGSGLHTLIEKKFGGVPRLHRLHFDEPPAWSFEKIREGKAWEQVEREAAKERKTKAGESNLPTTESTSRGNSTTSKGKTRDKVGEKIGVSGA